MKLCHMTKWGGFVWRTHGVPYNTPLFGLFDLCDAVLVDQIRLKFCLKDSFLRFCNTFRPNHVWVISPWVLFCWRCSLAQFASECILQVWSMCVMQPFLTRSGSNAVSKIDLCVSHIIRHNGFGVIPLWVLVGGCTPKMSNFIWGTDSRISVLTWRYRFN